MSHFSLKPLRYYWQTSRSRRQLLKLDDRLLADIGITRSQAKNEAQKHFWNLPSNNRSSDENR